MKNILWISAMAPYDRVPHAGGKIHNWYLKRLNKEQSVKIKVATFCKPEEVDAIDLSDYGIDYYLCLRPRGGIKNVIRLLAFVSKSFIWNRYAGLVPLDYQQGINKLIKQVKNDCFEPEIIILQWTEILFFLPMIKDIWPNSKYVAIEEDVSYLGQLRKADYYKNRWVSWFFYSKYKNVKKLEISYLNSVDIAIFNNQKDFNLAKGDGFVGNSLVWAPYYLKANIEVTRNYSTNIVFYGAMNREENWKSAIWFIENVLPMISDLNVRLEIIGANPNKKLYSYQNERVIIRGFVDDIETAIGNALCLVAPLVLGAGIKIKIIEAMAIGVPVLTNSIGIEGIPAKDGTEYIHCENSEDYCNAIEFLLKNPEARFKIANAAKNFISSTLNYETDSDKFNRMILEL